MKYKTTEITLYMVSDECVHTNIILWDDVGVVRLFSWILIRISHVHIVRYLLHIHVVTFALQCKQPYTILHCPMILLHMCMFY